jgi:hypothetical protein
MNVEIGTEVTQLFLGIHKWDFRCSVVLRPESVFKHTETVIIVVVCNFVQNGAHL